MFGRVTHHDHHLMMSSHMIIHATNEQVRASMWPRVCIARDKPFKFLDQSCDSPSCQPYNSYNVSSENLVLDQLIIPNVIFFFILITYLVDIGLTSLREILSWSLMKAKESSQNLDQWTFRLSNQNLGRPWGEKNIEYSLTKITSAKWWAPDLFCKLKLHGFCNRKLRVNSPTRLWKRVSKFISSKSAEISEIIPKSYHNVWTRKK